MSQILYHKPKSAHLIMGKSLGFKEEHSFTHVAIVISEEVFQKVLITPHFWEHKHHF